MRDILVFDFLSHEFMHHPFNEGYTRVLAAAFPGDRILFCADAKHLGRLAVALADLSNISFIPVTRLAARFGQSLHNPLAGRLAAYEAWRSMRAVMAGRDVKFGALLGFDANLLSLVSTFWPAATQFHLIVHNHMSAAMAWRSRNPLIRGFDLRAAMRKNLPAAFRIVTLELGIAEALAELAPAWAPHIVTLEHPILTSEWGVARLPVNDTLNIGFVGHASRDKGFDLFLDIARRYAGRGMAFSAIGIASPEALRWDLTPLLRPPAANSVARPDFVAALAEMDFVCLPLGENYRYVASGSLIDAIAAAKPLLTTSNGSIDAMVRRYGSIGLVAADRDQLAAAFESPGGLRGHYAKWLQTITAIRAARTPPALAKPYAELVLR